MTEKHKEQALLEEFRQVTPVFSELFVFKFLRDKDILSSRTLSNIKKLVTEQALYEGYDTNTNLINTYKGVFNIATRKVEPRNNRLFDRILPHYDPIADAPAFTQLLDNYNTPDYPDLSEDLLNLFAYQLFGNNKLKTFFIAWGDGNNAKSTLWQLVENALGSSDKGGYANKVSSETFIADGKSFNVGLTEINNSRFLFADEIKQGVELDGNLIKQAVAGEGSTIKFNEKGNKHQVTANVLTPVTLLLNEVPNFKSADQATINRLAVIEFTKQFMPGDKEAEALIEQAKQEQAGIFNLIESHYNPDWVIPKRWRLSALTIVDEQKFDDDILYKLQTVLAPLIHKTGDAADKVKRSELHAELDKRYKAEYGEARPSTRELIRLMPRLNIGLSGNYYTKILLDK